MDALALLREQATTADSLLTQVVANLTAEQALWHLEGSTANPIASTLMHIAFGEDRTVQRRCLGQPTIFEAGGWRARIGFDPDAPWAPASSVDPDAMRAYASEVRAATDSFLAAVQPADLERELEGPRGRRPMLAILSLMLVIHKANHTGEIAALLGSQGVRGFPF
jgi:uncharacterized damage-inducible protein DinB